VTTIHPANLHDLPGLYRVCLQTGDSGKDATQLYRNPDLLGHVYVGPYAVGQPHLAFALMDADGVVGYVLGAEDTRAFEQWEEAHWWPALREQYPQSSAGAAARGGAAAGGPRGESPDDLLIREIHRPTIRSADVVRAYPAHMHIDLLERVRGQGMGRAMVERLLAALGEGGSTGVHLGVSPENRNAIEFYRHLGFVELDSTRDAIFMGLWLGDAPAARTTRSPARRPVRRCR
jgi:ribosomal protein S18 acetylase RimI-like enzyme